MSGPPKPLESKLHGLAAHSVARLVMSFAVPSVQ